MVFFWLPFDSFVLNTSCFPPGHGCESNMCNNTSLMWMHLSNAWVVLRGQCVQRKRSSHQSLPSLSCWHEASRWRRIETRAVDGNGCLYRLSNVKMPGDLAVSKILEPSQESHLPPASDVWHEHKLNLLICPSVSFYGLRCCLRRLSVYTVWAEVHVFPVLRWRVSACRKRDSFLKLLHACIQ